MKKLYVTVSDSVYTDLERAVSDYESLYDCKATKSLIVDRALKFYLSKVFLKVDSWVTPRCTSSLFSREENVENDVQHSLSSVTGHYSNDALFKDDKKWTT